MFHYIYGETYPSSHNHNPPPHTHTMELVSDHPCYVPDSASAEDRLVNKVDPCPTGNGREEVKEENW